MVTMKDALQRLVDASWAELDARVANRERTEAGDAAVEEAELESGRARGIAMTLLSQAEKTGVIDDPVVPVALLQPIDTAPRDGTFALLFGGLTSEDFYSDDKPPPGVRERPVVAKWDPSAYGPYGEGGWVHTFWDGAWRSTYDNPTHWMPLAALPSV